MEVQSLLTIEEMESNSSFVSRLTIQSVCGHPPRYHKYVFLKKMSHGEGCCKFSSRGSAKIRGADLTCERKPESITDLKDLIYGLGK